MEKNEKLERYRLQNRSAAPGGIVCAGSSLMEMFPVERLVAEKYSGISLYNRGVSGFVIKELVDAIDVCILDLKPSRLFINIGTNDMNDPAVTPDMLMERYDSLLAMIEEALPGTEIYLMAYYPVNYEAASDEMREILRIRNNGRIALANQRVSELAQRHKARYIDINRNLKDGEGRLKAEFTIEGMHINEAGYRAIFDDFMTYVKEPAWKREDGTQSP